MDNTEAANQVRIDITPAKANEALVSSIKEKMERIVSALCIDRAGVAVPQEHKDFYIPDKVSIGPLHYGEGPLKAMEEHKWRYLYALLNRKPDIEASLDACVKALKGLEHKARLCYVENINISSDEFVKMMLLDGGFIIELFLRHAVKVLRRRNDPLFSSPGSLSDLRRDMMLLENQIPFFILQRLFEIVPLPEKFNQSLTSLAFQFFRNMIPGDRTIHRERFSLDGNHLLDLIRHCFLPTIPRVKPSEANATQRLESAKMLKEAGVLIKKSKTENLLDIKFAHGVLEIPPIRVHQHTESLLRNLIAFEQCPCDNTQHISSYVILMKSLIPTRKDAKSLKRRQILINYDVDENDGSRLFDRLSKGVNEGDLKDFCFDGLCEQVMKYKKTGWRRVLSKKKKRPQGKAALPETKIFGIAILLLVITSVGTLFSVLSFFLHH